MSSIHYKFRSLVSYKTVNFETLHVSVEELKKAIFGAENLDPEKFDLVIENSHTKREYSGADIIPRNSSLIVKRVPRQDAAKLPKIQDTSTSGIVSKVPANVSEMNFIKTEDFSKMTEEERLEHVKQVSYQKYQPSNYQKKPKYSMLSDPPPPNYVCNRCNRTGHWVKNCPLATIRRTTGLPIDELVETTPDDPGAMLHPSGKFMVQKMHLNARLNSKAKAPLPFLRDGESRVIKSEDENEKPKVPMQERMPSELLCPICNDLISEAVVMTCCGSSFCAECVQNLIVEEPGRNCPGEGCDQQLSVDAMVRNISLRKAVENFKKKQQEVQWPGLSQRAALHTIGSQAQLGEKPIVPQKCSATVSPKVVSKPESVPVTKTSVQVVDFTRPPPQIVVSNNPIVMIPDLTKPPPSFQVPPNLSLTKSTTLPIVTSQSTQQQNTKLSSQSVSVCNRKNSEDSPLNQDFSTPPHVQTPPNMPTPPFPNLNSTLPSIIEDSEQKKSPKRVELSQKAIEAFTAFNPTAPIALFASVNLDASSSGLDSVLFQSVNKIDPVTGRLVDASGKLQPEPKRRSPASRRQRNSRSPARSKKRRSPSPYRRFYTLRRYRSPERRSSETRSSYPSKRRIEDYKRDDERKKKRGRSNERKRDKLGERKRNSFSPVHKRSKKSDHSETYCHSRSVSKTRSKSPYKKTQKRRRKSSGRDGENTTASHPNTSTNERSSKPATDDNDIDKSNCESGNSDSKTDEEFIDTLIKETTLAVKEVVSESVGPSKIVPFPDHDDEDNQKEDEVEVKKDDDEVVDDILPLQLKETAQQASVKSHSTTPTNSYKSSPEKPTNFADFENQILVNKGALEAIFGNNEMRTLSEKDIVDPERSEKKLSRKKSGEKKAKHKHKKKKDRKHKRDHRSPFDDAKSKKKRTKKSKEKKHRKDFSSKKHRSQSVSSRHA